MPLEAVKKLQADFGIADVKFDKEPYKKECNTRMKQLLKEKQFERRNHAKTLAFLELLLSKLLLRLLPVFPEKQSSHPVF